MKTIVKNQPIRFNKIEVLLAISMLLSITGLVVSMHAGPLQKQQVYSVARNLADVVPLVEECLAQGKGVIGSGAGQCNLPAVSGLGSDLFVSTTIDIVGPTLSDTQKITAIIANTPQTKDTAGAQVTWSRTSKGEWTCQVKPAKTSGWSDAYIPGKCEKI